MSHFHVRHLAAEDTPPLFGYGSAAESTLVGSSLMSRMLLSMHLACQKAEAASTAINRQLRCFAMKEMQCLLGGQDVTTGDRKRMTTRH